MGEKNFFFVKMFARRENQRRPVKPTNRKRHKPPHDSYGATSEDDLFGHLLVININGSPLFDDDLLHFHIISIHQAEHIDTRCVTDVDLGVSADLFAAE